MMTINKRFLCVAVVGTLALGGCVSTYTPGQGTHNEWAGTYAQEQAQRKDADRGTALRVRKALANDPQLNALSLRIFVSRGEVSLCGKFPDAQTRARAVGIVSTVKGVSGVDTHCGQ
ncbi:MAG: BON domain-containing protein [Gammaproteobacteria bacterium]